MGGLTVTAACLSLWHCVSRDCYCMSLTSTLKRDRFFSTSSKTTVSILSSGCGNEVFGWWWLRTWAEWEVCSCKIYVGVLLPRMDWAKHTQGGTRFVQITGKLQRQYCRVHLSNWSPTTQASLVCELSSRPNTSYVAQHTPTCNSTLPPKGVCKHHQAVFSLTSTNGCH